MGRKASRDRREGIIDQRLARALDHPLRVEILAEVSKAPMSPVEFHRQQGGSLSSISYHFRELAKLGCLEMISTRQVRGSVEHRYQIVAQPLYTDKDWAALPATIRTSLDIAVYRTLMDQIAAAIESGTMEARANRYFTWTPVQLDEAGWRHIMDKLGTLLAEVVDEQVAAAERIAESGEAPIHTTVVLAGFESPRPRRDRLRARKL